MQSASTCIAMARLAAFSLAFSIVSPAFAGRALLFVATITLIASGATSSTPLGNAVGRWSWERLQKLEQTAAVRLYLLKVSQIKAIGDLARLPHLRVAINYGDHCCVRAQETNCQTAIHFGAGTYIHSEWQQFGRAYFVLLDAFDENGSAYVIDACLAFRSGAIDPSFRAQHETILSQRRGAGLWLWKPYVVAYALSQLHPTTSLLYMDAASNVTQPLSRVFDLPRSLSQGLVPFQAQTRWHERDFSRADVFHKLFPHYPGVDLVQVTESAQFLAGFSVWNQSIAIPVGCGRARGGTDHASPVSVTVSAREWAMTWLRWCTVPGLLDDTLVDVFAPPTREKSASAKEHTHDQSVFSVLVKLTLGAAGKPCWYEVDPTGQYRLPEAQREAMADAVCGRATTAMGPWPWPWPWVHLHRDRS